MAKKVNSDYEHASFFAAMKEKNGSFLSDAEEFVHSNRFLRFKDFVEEKLGEMVQGLPLLNKYQNPGFVSLIRESVQKYIASYNDEFTDDSFFVIDAMAAFPNRYTSNILLLNAMFQQINKKEISCDELDPVIIGALLNTLSNETQFVYYYAEAFTRACFDYVSIQTAQMGLISENWFRSCKEELDANHLLFIASKTFEYTLQDISDGATFDCLTLTNENSTTPALLMRVHELSEEKDSNDKSNEKRIKEAQKALDEERKKHLQTQEKYEKLRDSTAEAITTDDVKKMKAEIDALRASKQSLASANTKLTSEIQRMKDEYQSLSDYVNILTSQEDEVEPSDAPAESSDLWYKRIVFVRDKKDEGYLLMQKLSEMFPNAKFTNGIASDIDVNCTDAIVALIAYTCHGTYWGACGIAKKNDIPFVAIKNKNVDIIAARIQKELDNKRKES